MSLFKKSIFREKNKLDICTHSNFQFKVEEIPICDQSYDSSNINLENFALIFDAT